MKAHSAQAVGLVIAPNYNQFLLYLRWTNQTISQARYVGSLDQLYGWPDQKPLFIVNADLINLSFRHALVESGILQRFALRYVNLDNFGRKKNTHVWLDEPCAEGTGEETS
ncbi:MAG: hypothetical protein UY48_C0002G0019 [Candidatus Gottesmanbacteria bacterium GW2011_GWB1_49_7]|uniref:Uncharacterized protein n=1 Tax=Candidatus Gottesmanbacteria bacterium GW2011_GWB1_49_7 TaxID=1618448 RepID=A0A0G1W3P6_9BACT|nr:MAG: hypothetical protein UY48_C0002G0019 [Candidatus Gottesmanbacteria bacterium GW2011_GWB1_49_7]